jgi:carbon-monoxide dehydrogenase large subunit
MRPLKFGVGQPHVRVEDPALLTGRGRYLADVVPADALRAFVVRSPHAHARFRITDLEAAKRIPGVRLILTAADVADLGTFPAPGATFFEPVGEQAIWVPPLAALAKDVVRHVGDAVAFVVADTLEAAKDAAEAVAIDWQPLPAAVDMRSAIKPGAPQVWSERANNIAFTDELGDQAATESAFAKAAQVVKLEIVNQRIVTNYMETRGVIAEVEHSGRITLNVTSQGVYTMREILAGAVLKIPKDKLRIISGDVGGGFGTKAVTYREYALAAVAARKLEKPVAWIADRNEHFIGDTQGRDHVTLAEMALDAEGRFLAMKVDTLANMGAYQMQVAAYIPHLGATMAPGVYNIPALFARVRGVYTHTLPVEAYRGAGRPEAAFLIERLVDAVARARDEAPDALRRRNFVRQSEMPHTTGTGRVYDSGDFAGHLKRAQELADWKGFTKRLRESKKRGRLRGIGLSCYIEACGMTAPEDGKVQLERDGTVTVFSGALAQGQGHKTTYAQIVGQELDLPPEQITVLQGDSDHLGFGGGTVGSRSMPTGAPVVQMATRQLADNLKAIAAKELEAKPEELEIAGGAVRVAGTNRALSLAQIAEKTPPEKLIGEVKAFMPSAATYPNGTHCAEVEIDPATGEVVIVGYTVVDDFGVTLNPLLLQGQVQGGVAQGVGQALMENTVYDEAGQLLTASLMDYALPRADHMPNIAFETKNVPCTTNPMGVKGAGEAGTVGTCPAVMNAVVDALYRAYGITHLDMPATPERVWRAIEDARRAQA